MLDHYLNIILSSAAQNSTSIPVGTTSTDVVTPLQYTYSAMLSVGSNTLLDRLAKPADNAAANCLRTGESPGAWLVYHS